MQSKGGRGRRCRWWRAGERKHGLPGSQGRRSSSSKELWGRIRGGACFGSVLETQCSRRGRRAGPAHIPCLLHTQVWDSQKNRSSVNTLVITCIFLKKNFFFVYDSLSVLTQLREDHSMSFLLEKDNGEVNPQIRDSLTTGKYLSILRFKANTNRTTLNFYICKHFQHKFLHEYQRSFS